MSVDPANCSITLSLTEQHATAWCRRVGGGLGRARSVTKRRTMCSPTCELCGAKGSPVRDFRTRLWYKSFVKQILTNFENRCIIIILYYFFIFFFLFSVIGMRGNLMNYYYTVQLEPNYNTVIINITGILL